MESTGKLFWREMNLLMDHLAQVDRYQASGKIVPIGAAAVSGSLVRYGGYSWVVLATNAEEKAFLLLAHKLLAVMPMKYHGSDVPVTWAESDIRAYLNSTFAGKLIPMEKVEVLETTIKNPDTPRYDVPGGADTTDRVFLLSLEEIVKYLGDNGQYMKKSWAHADGNEAKHCLIIDEYNSFRRAKNEFGEPFHYWLRSAGCDPAHAAIVNDEGVIDIYGLPVVETAGVRPAIWVRVN